MWVYRVVLNREQENNEEYHVGFWNQWNEWYLDEIFDSREKARARINYLNGGNSKEFEEIMSDICDLLDRDSK